MPWIRLDDKYWRNEKMRRLSHAARGVFCDALSYCADTHEPTGFLTHSEALQRGPRRHILELEGNGNLEPVNGGYLIHDFEKYLDKGSRDRCRVWREKKRNERHANVTGASPRATGLETISTSGLYPVPNPVPERTSRTGLKPPDNGLTYGIPKVSMHPSEAAPISKILGTLTRQPMGRKI